jgi:hypothetical protein
MENEELKPYDEAHRAIDMEDPLRIEGEGLQKRASEMFGRKCTNCDIQKDSCWIPIDLNDLGKALECFRDSWISKRIGILEDTKALAIFKLFCPKSCFRTHYYTREKVDQCLIYIYGNATAVQIYEICVLAKVGE